MIGRRDPPPMAGSPCRRLCSSIRRERRRGSRRGAGATGLKSTCTAPRSVTPSRPKPSRRQRLRNRRVGLATLTARRHGRRQPHLVARRDAVDALQHEFEIEAELEFANDNDRRLAGAQGQEVAAADFAFDGKTQPFEEILDGNIERGFQHEALGPRHAQHPRPSLECRQMPHVAFRQMPRIKGNGVHAA